MPTYDFRCQECGAYLKKFLPISQRDSMPACEDCGGCAQRVIRSAPYFAGQPGGDSCGSCSATPSRCRTCAG